MLKASNLFIFQNGTKHSCLCYATKLTISRVFSVIMLGKLLSNRVDNIREVFFIQLLPFCLCFPPYVYPLICPISLPSVYSCDRRPATHEQKFHEILSPGEACTSKYQKLQNMIIEGWFRDQFTKKAAGPRSRLYAFWLFFQNYLKEVT